MATLEKVLLLFLTKKHSSIEDQSRPVFPQPGQESFIPSYRASVKGEGMSFCDLQSHQHSCWWVIHLTCTSAPFHIYTLRETKDQIGPPTQLTHNTHIYIYIYISSARHVGWEPILLGLKILVQVFGALKWEELYLRCCWLLFHVVTWPWTGCLSSFEGFVFLLWFLIWK